MIRSTSIGNHPLRSACLGVPTVKIRMAGQYTDRENEKYPMDGLKTAGVADLNGEGRLHLMSCEMVSSTVNVLPNSCSSSASGTGPGRVRGTAGSGDWVGLFVSRSGG